MEVKAVAKHIRISPRKVRYVADLVRGKGEHNNGMSGDDLFIKTIFVDEGVTWKRIKPRAMGRADRIYKRCCHITVVVDEREEA